MEAAQLSTLGAVSFLRRVCFPLTSRMCHRVSTDTLIQQSLSIIEDSLLIGEQKSSPPI